MGYVYAIPDTHAHIFIHHSLSSLKPLKFKLLNIGLKTAAPQSMFRGARKASGPMMTMQSVKCSVATIATFAAALKACASARFLRLIAKPVLITSRAT